MKSKHQLTRRQSKNFNNTHQIIGLVVTVCVVIQFALGFFHHRMYKKTKQPTPLSPFHVWIGRIVIPLAIIDGFL